VTSRTAINLVTVEVFAQPPCCPVPGAPLPAIVSNGLVLDIGREAAGSRAHPPRARSSGRVRAGARGDRQRVDRRAGDLPVPEVPRHDARLAGRAASIRP